MDKQKCKQMVSRDAWHTGPCYRLAVKDGYCKQHHPASVALREKQKEDRYQKKVAASPYAKIGKLKELLKLALDALERTHPPKDGHTESVCEKIREVLIQ